jgi:sialic acid synthase SpsE
MVTVMVMVRVMVMVMVRVRVMVMVRVTVRVRVRVRVRVTVRVRVMSNSEDKQGEKVREFWIVAKADSNYEAFEFPCGDYSGHYRAVRVIEKSYADALLSQLKSAQDELSLARQDRDSWRINWATVSRDAGNHIEKLEADLHKHKDALKVAREALVDALSSPEGHIAKSAQNAIDKINEVLK